MSPALIFDVDGTLVDSNYHHAIAWFRAFREAGLTIPVWRLHRAIGMGGDMLVAHVAGDEVEKEYGDRVRDSWSRFADLLLGEIRPFEEASGVLRELAGTHTVVLASSGQKAHIEHFLQLLDVDDVLTAVVTGDDVEKSKPHTDLLDVAREKAGSDAAVMIGDSVWDCEAAGRAGLPVVATLGGGFGADELRDAGAAQIVTDLTELPKALSRIDASAPH